MSTGILILIVFLAVVGIFYYATTIEEEAPRTKKTAVKTSDKPEKKKVAKTTKATRKTTGKKVNKTVRKRKNNKGR